MSKPIIAVTALFNNKDKSIYMLQSYLSAIIEAGGTPVILPLINNKEDIKSLVERFDGFLLTGGEDINPKIYNEKKKNYCDDISSIRDEMEIILIEEIINSNKSILAICRGFQLLNSYLGGSLYQDITIERNNGQESIHKQEEPYNRVTHMINIKEDSLLYKILKKNKLTVNSMHHQGIKGLSKMVKEAAISEDGIIESIYLNDRRFALGVQWHPERLYKEFEDHFLIFKEFINSCR